MTEKPVSRLTAGIEPGFTAAAATLIVLTKLRSNTKYTNDKVHGTKQNILKVSRVFAHTADLLLSPLSPFVFFCVQV